MSEFTISLGYKTPLLVGLSTIKWTFADDSVVKGVGAGFAIRDPLLRPATLVVQGLGAEALELDVAGDGSEQVNDSLLVSWWQSEALDKAGFHFTFTTVKEESPAVEVKSITLTEAVTIADIALAKAESERAQSRLLNSEMFPDVAGPVEAAGG